MIRILLGVLVLSCVTELAAEQNAFSDTEKGSSHSEIEQRLDQKRDMMFNDATLIDVRTFLETSGISTYIDERALDDVGIGIDMPLTFRYRSIRIRDGLSLLLDKFDLTWSLRGGYVIITTPEKAERRLITRVYDVRNLVEPIPVAFRGGGRYGPDFDSLIDLISSSMAPTTWDTVGGPGSIDAYCTPRMRVIVVSQTYDIHRQIDSLLRGLAEYGGKEPLPEVVAYPPTGPLRTLSTPPLVGPVASSHRVRSSRLRSTGQ